MTTADLTKTASTELSTAADLGAWGENEMSSKDLVIPRLGVAQGLTKLVTAGKMKTGDFFGSDGEVLGSLERPLHIIPFYMKKWWINQKWVSKGNGGKWEYVSREPMTPSNESFPWDYEGRNPETGKPEKMRRVYTLDFFVLVIDQQSGQPRPLPFMTSFSSSSAKAGKELATLMYTANAMQNLPPCAKVVELGGISTTNDSGTFVVKTIKPLRPSSKEEIESAFFWFQKVKSGAAKAEEHEAEDNF